MSATFRSVFGPLLLATLVPSVGAQVVWERDMRGIWAYSSFGLADGGVLNVGNASGGNQSVDDLLAYRLTATGDSAWHFRETSAGVRADDFRTGAPIDDGSFYAAGLYDENVNSGDAVIVRYAATGQVMWRDRFNGTSNQRDQFTALLAVSDGIYAAGESGGDALLVKYSPTGTRQWAKTYNGAGNHDDFTVGLHPGPDGGAVLVVSATIMYHALAQRINPVVIRYAADGTVLGTHVFDLKQDPNNLLDGGLRPAASAIDGAGNVYVLNGLDQNTSPTLLKVGPTGTQGYRVTLDLQAPTRIRGQRPYSLFMHPGGDLVAAVEQVVEGNPTWTTKTDMVVAALRTSDGAVRWVNRRQAIVPAHVAVGPGDALFAVSDHVYLSHSGGRDSTAALVRRLDPADGRVTWSYRTRDGYNANAWGGSHLYRKGVARLARGNGNTLFLTYRRYASESSQGDATKAFLRTVRLDTSVPSSVLTAGEAELRASGGVVFHGAAPHPFAGRTTLRFSLDAPGAATLRVYDLTGRQVAVLLESAWLTAGDHSVPLAAPDLTPGTYLCRLDVGHTTHTVAVTMLR